MTTELRPCPCGKVPTEIHINEGGSVKWAWASGNCCDEWHTEFRTFYTVEPDELMGYAVAGWNAAPRGERVCEWTPIKDPYACNKTSCGHNTVTWLGSSIDHKYCQYCGGKIQVKEQSE